MIYAIERKTGTTLKPQPDGTVQEVPVWEPVRTLPNTGSMSAEEIILALVETMRAGQQVPHRMVAELHEGDRPSYWFTYLGDGLFLAGIQHPHPGLTDTAQ